MKKFWKKQASPKVKKIRSRRGGKQTTLRGRLMRSMICLTAAVSAAIAVVTCTLSYYTIRSNMQQQVTRISTAYKQSVENAIKNYSLSLEAIAANPSITSTTSPQSMWKDTLNFLATSYHFSEAGLADKNGKTLDGADISKTDYFQNGSYGGGSYLSTMTKQESGGMALYLASKVNNGTGYDGVVYAKLDSDAFNQVIDGLSIGQKGFGFIIDKAGKIIAHKNPKYIKDEVNYIELAKKNPAYADAAGLVRKMATRRAGSTSCTIDGQQLYVAYAPISGTDYNLAVAADVPEMMADLYKSIWFITAVAAVFIAVSILLAARVSGPIARSVGGLVGRIGGLEKGDLHSEVPPVHTRDEIETLSRAFSNTVGALNGDIGEISHILGAMAQGDFSVRPQRDYTGDFQAIRDALSAILASMSETFRRIRGMADQVAGGSRQMSNASQALAQGAAEQSATIQELSESVRKIAGQAEGNAKSARRADELSNEATQAVSDGTRQMERLTGAMGRISDSSEKIEKIIKTIQDIAFQTNILALNAAVEAARAGEAGRGFSVVADEVRNLANRSAEAVKSTSALIQSSGEAVKDGLKTTEETGRSLKAVTEAVQQVGALLDSIAKAADGQAQSVRKVDGNVEQISAVVQTNSATAEESAATSEELNRLAEALSETMAKFQLAAQSGAAVPDAAAPEEEEALPAGA
ncbi:MAG TPA: hypothetical protein DD737_04635 [Ruminococcaceae bacterium]|jgi:methyl-accepting chemotaxis protein|nr:hypothetical protein [Oscillospiraceae bacterium]